MNKVFISGNLGRNADITSKTVKFSVAVKGYKDETIWVNCVMFYTDKMARAYKFLKKGAGIIVEGHLQNPSKREDGSYYAPSIIADRFEITKFADTPKEDNFNGVVDDDDAPF